MKYLAAFVIGVGLMAGSPAFADEYIYRPDLDDYIAPLYDCKEAAKDGIELDTEIDEDGMVKRYLYGKRIYLLAFNELGPVDLVLRCLFVKLDEVVPVKP